MSSVAEDGSVVPADFWSKRSVQAEDGSFVPASFYGGKPQTLDARVQALESSLDNVLRQRSAPLPNMRDLRDAALSKVQNSQVPMYSSATGRWEPGDVLLSLLGLRGATASTDIISMGVTGDLTDRLVIDADGTMHIGDGSTAAVRALRLGATQVAVGRESGVGTANTVAVGFEALEAVGAGGDVAVGYQALKAVTTGSAIGIGIRAATALTTGVSVIAIGGNALDDATTANRTVAVGYEAMSNGANGSDCVAVGYEALRSCSAAENVGVGHQALKATSTGTRCVGVGATASPTAGAAAKNDVTLIGHGATTTQDDATALGSATSVSAAGGTALGKGAVVDHGNSVALGNGTTTTDAGQVQIGGRHIEAAELGADPSAPATNGARLYARDNGSGKTQLCVRFASGAVQVLATQP